MSIRLPLLLSLLATVLASEDPHAGHDHGGEAGWEWAGIFATPEDVYLWTAQSKKDGTWADPTMHLVVLPAPDDAETTLHGLEDTADHAWEHCSDDRTKPDSPAVELGGVITPDEHKCYNLHFDSDVWQSLFKIDAKGHSHLAIFAQHFPTEFERDAHYLKDEHGEDIEPVHEIPSVVEKFDKPWGEAIGASIVVMVCTLIGVVFARGPLAVCAKKYQGPTFCLMSAFAAGALLAATIRGDLPTVQRWLGAGIDPNAYSLDVVEIGRAHV